MSNTTETPLRYLTDYLTAKKKLSLNAEQYKWNVRVRAARQADLTKVDILKGLKEHWCTSTSTGQSTKES